MGKRIRGFMDFVREQAVVGLAIGLILGAGAKEVVDNFVKGIVDPFIALIMPQNTDLSSAVWSFKDVQFQWGLVAYTLLKFIIIAAIVYFVISKLAKHFDKPKEK